MKGDSKTPQAARENITAVARLEQELQERRTPLDRLADTVAAFVGSMPFIIVHLLWFAVWILINTGHVPFIKPYDPYPFILLSLAVSCEGVLLATFVLMKQNRMSRAADQRAHLNLQIDLLAEKEITKILQLQRMLCERFGVEQAVRDREVEDLSRETAVSALARDLEESLPAD